MAFGITGIYDPDEADRILDAEIIEETPGKPKVDMPEEIEPKKETPRERQAGEEPEEIELPPKDSKSG